MNMKSFLIWLLISCFWKEMVVAFVGPRHVIRSSTKEFYMAGNAAVFSGGREEEYDSQNQIPTKITTQQKYVTKAQRLRQEANEMEMALQVETLANTLVSTLIPIVSEISTATTLKQQQQHTPSTTATTVYRGGTLPVADLRSKMAYLSIGDAARISYELDRLKSKGRLSSDLQQPVFTVIPCDCFPSITTRNNHQPHCLVVVPFPPQAIFVSGSPSNSKNSPISPSAMPN